MNILGKNIAPGTKALVKMSIARLHTHTVIEVPVIVERAKADGPCLLLLGGIHGNEINGVEIVRKIVAMGLNKPEKGTVICIPVLNVFGFLNLQREFPDGRDLNRVFPGSASGSLASRFAHFMMEEIMPHIDYCIDYHTGGDGRFNYPQLRIAENDETIELAKAFGTRFVKFAPHREKSFREVASSLNKKVLLFEGGRTLFLDKKVTNYGVQGAVNVMEHLGMISPNANRPALRHFPERQVTIKTAVWIRAKYSGMFRAYVKLGKFLKKGDVIGTISDPFGTFEKEVKAPNNGYLFALEQMSIVNQGSALARITTSITESSYTKLAAQNKGTDMLL